MFKHYFEGIANIEIGPIISMILFILFFLLVIIWIFKLDGKFIDKMKNLPLEDGNKGQDKTEN